MVVFQIVLSAQISQVFRHESQVLPWHFIHCVVFAVEVYANEVPVLPGAALEVQAGFNLPLEEILLSKLLYFLPALEDMVGKELPSQCSLKEI